MNPVAKFAFGTVLVALAGCQSISETVTSQWVPTSEEVEALSLGVVTSFVDPVSIQIAAMTATGVIQKNIGPVKIICLMANAKNRVGGYNGFKWTVFYFSMDNQFLAADGNSYATAVCRQLTAVPV